jgi:hypothetical protein
MRRRGEWWREDEPEIKKGTGDRTDEGTGNGKKEQ